MPASQLFSLTLALLFAIINRHRVQRRFLCSGIEAVITGLTRKFEAFWLICPRGLASHGAESGVCIKIFPAYLASKSCICPKDAQGGAGENRIWRVVRVVDGAALERLSPFGQFVRKEWLNNGLFLGCTSEFPLVILHRNLAFFQMSCRTVLEN